MGYDRAFLSARPTASRTHLMRLAPCIRDFQLEIFEGPLDLLLHLIKKNEVDVHDIPIATITDQYLGYRRSLRADEPRSRPVSIW